MLVAPNMHAASDTRLVLDSMTGTEALSQLVERSHSLAELLEAVSRTIAREAGADTCFIFLRERGNDRLCLRYNLGDAVLSEQVKSAAEGLAAQALSQLIPASAEQ